jgi:hypothetical protein
MRRVGGLSDEMTPVLAGLHDVAPDVNRVISQLGPFSQAGIPALKSLGEAGKVGIPAMRDARPVVADLRRLGKVARPVGKTARMVLESFKKGRGVQRLLDYAFYQVAAVNGYDSFGHYLRARLILNTCSRYYTKVVAGCSSKFAASASQSSAVSASAAATSDDPILERTSAALAGKNPDSAAPAPTPAPKQKKSGSTDRGSARPARTPAGPAAPSAGAPSSSTGNTNAGEGATGPLLDYLFGKDGG